jgi:hypothetical protein
MKSPSSKPWEMSPYALIRMSGADQTLLTDLRFSRSFEHVRNLHTLERWLAENRGHVCDEVLYQVIGDCQGSVKSKIVGIRRRLYNDKLPRVQEMQVLRQISCARSKRAVLRYFFRLRRYLSMQSGDGARHAREIFKAELIIKREDLVRYLADEKFLKALQVASPSLADSIIKLLQKHPSQWAKKERQIEVRAIRYLTRMVVKTSPFGRFGPVALASYDSSVQETISYDVSDMQVETVSTLNLSFVDKIISRLWRQPELVQHLPVRINQSYFIDNGDLCFYQPYEKNNYPKYTALRRGRFIREIQVVLGCIEGSASSMTSHMIADKISRDGLCEGWSEASKVHQLVESLIGSGLLIRQWGVATSRQDRISELLRAADDAGVKLPEQWREDIELLRRCGHAFSSQSLRDRDRMIQRSDALLERLLEEQASLKDRLARDRRLFVEDSYVSGGRFVIGEAFWRTLREDLSAFLDLIFRRDVGGLGHQMFKDIFIQHYGEGGECVSLTKFANELSKTAFRSDMVGTSAFRHSSSVNENALSYFRSLLEVSAGAAGTPEYDIGAAGFRSMADNFPSLPPGRKSIALHLQFVASSVEALKAGDFDVVLNYTLPGHGRFFTRYCDFFDRKQPDQKLSCAIRRQLERLSESLGGVEILEVLSIVNHNAQVHEPLTQRVVVAPGETSPLSSECSVEARDLMLKHDSEKNAMSFHLGEREVLPMYMGFFHSMSLPYSHRVLVDCSPHSYHAERNKLSEFQENLVPFSGPSKEENKIRHYPRLRCGRLVLQRETWSVDIDAIAADFIDTEDDFDLFVRANMWRMRHDIPRACFVRVKRRKESPSDVYNLMSPNEHKPMLLDFENFFTLKSFVAMISAPGAQSVQIEESLPDIGVTPLEIDGKSVTMEIQVELNQD